MSVERLRRNGAEVGVLRDEDAVIEAAEKAGRAFEPSEVVGAVRDIYERAASPAMSEAFELAAIMIGDHELAGYASLDLVSEEAISTLRRRIAEIPREIAGLVGENDRKAREVEALLGQIERRKGEIIEKRSRTGIKGAWMRLVGDDPRGVPIECAFERDPALRDLERRLRALELERGTIAGTLTRLRAPRPDIEKHLVRLRDVASRLFDTLEDEPRDRGSGLLAIAALEARRRRRERLLENLEAQRAILEALKADAEAIGAKLDHLLAHLCSVIAELRTQIASLRAVPSDAEERPGARHRDGPSPRA